MNTQLKFSTTDLYLAVVLSVFFPIDSIDKSNPQKGVFTFKRQDGLDNVIEAYWRRELKIEPQSLFTQLKAIKTRLYEI